MKKIFVAILIVVLSQAAIGNITSPIYAQDYPFPPLSPDTSWQPPFEGSGSMDPPAKVELYRQTWSNLQIPPPSAVAPGIPSSIISAYLVNNYGQILTNLYRNGTCYLVVSFNGPGYFYLWEYYPSGSASFGHWLCYRWYCPYAGIWKIGPFTAESLDPAGQYTWKMWFLSGLNWSTRSLSFDFTRSYYAPDIPGLIPGPISSPVINSFSANKSSIEAGETAMLTWTTTNTSSVTISPDIGAVAISGSTSVTPATTITYTLLAKGKSGNPISSTATITFMPRITPTISISQATIESGESASLSWNAPAAIRVSISDIGNVGSKGTTQVSPDETTTYTLTATYIDGTAQSTSATVMVEQPFYLLWGLIALLVLAAIVILLLLLRRPAKVHRAQQAATQAGNSAQSDGTHSTDTQPATTPIMEAVPAKLVMSDGNEILLADNARSFGRRDFEGFMTTDHISYISRQHITIWHENGQYYIEDRSSTNGTKINSTNIKGTGRHSLTDGDVIELAGKLSIIFKENTDKEVQ
jgi:hypothetical protein